MELEALEHPKWCKNLPKLPTAVDNFRKTPFKFQTFEVRNLRDPPERPSARLGRPSRRNLGFVVDLYGQTAFIYAQGALRGRPANVDSFAGRP